MELPIGFRVSGCFGTKHPILGVEGLRPLYEHYYVVVVRIARVYMGAARITLEYTRASGPDAIEGDILNKI